MPSKKHEEILSGAIKIFREQGLRVIRLDKRTVPNAIVVDFDNKKIDALEASTNIVNIYLTRMKYERSQKQFDEEIIATPYPKKRKRGKSIEAYFLALKLRKQGFTERGIQKEIHKKLGEHCSSGIIHYWVTGKCRPYSVNYDIVSINES